MEPTQLQVQARALGDPTRHAVFEYVTAADRAVGVAELTDHFGLNHNAIRQHLAKLVHAALVLEATAPTSGRGRPRLEYRVHPNAESRWGVVGPYERLSVLLTEVLRTGDPPEEVGRRTAFDEHRNSSDGPVDALVDEMTRQGFAPEVRRRGTTTEVILAHCPFASAVLTDADTVCDLHLGLARGVADAVGGITVEELVRKDPRRAHCRLRCRIDDPE